MTILWASSPIQIRDELQVDVKASAESVTFGTYNDAVQASDLVLTPEQAMEIADALTQGAAKCLAARGEA
jgi:hypothetical protein